MILTVCIFSLINTSSMELKIVEACFIFRGPTRKPALATSKARKRWREDLDKNEVELTGQKHNVMSKPQACILQSSTKYYSSLKTGRWFRRCKLKKKNHHCKTASSLWRCKPEVVPSGGTFESANGHFPATKPFYSCKPKVAYAEGTFAAANGNFLATKLLYSYKPKVVHAEGTFAVANRHFFSTKLCSCCSGIPAAIANHTAQNWVALIGLLVETATCSRRNSGPVSRQSDHLTHTKVWKFTVFASRLYRQKAMLHTSFLSGWRQMVWLNRFQLRMFWCNGNVWRTRNGLRYCTNVLASQGKNILMGIKRKVAWWGGGGCNRNFIIFPRGKKRPCDCVSKQSNINRIIDGFSR